mmetsp:Transcript_18861/g.33247  ORF Transcript_18861/g.33247 Transcript_18861/m.33247 type:complete len:278 (-) Transcript_18861:114-947(-)
MKQKAAVIYYFLLRFVVLSAFSSAQPTNNVTTEELVDCPLCADPSHTPQDPFSVFVSGESTLSCQTAYDLGILRLPQDNCTFWQNRGTNICQCAAEPPPRNDCTLCEDGGLLPDPFLEGRPGIACAQLQIEAKRDNLENCIVWQQTQGVYCGCENPNVTSDEYSVCRFCADDVDLFDPLAIIVQTRNLGKSDSFSCGEAEFEANLPENSGRCLDYMELYGKHCCRVPSTLPPIGGNISTENGGTSNAVRTRRTSLLCSSIVINAAITFWMILPAMLC